MITDGREREWSMTDLAREIGVSYRRLNLWLCDGVLGFPWTPGSGVPRRISNDETVDRLRVVAQVSNALAELNQSATHALSTPARRAVYEMAFDGAITVNGVTIRWETP